MPNSTKRQTSEQIMQIWLLQTDTMARTARLKNEQHLIQMMKPVSQAIHKYICIFVKENTADKELRPFVN